MKKIVIKSILAGLLGIAPCYGMSCDATEETLNIHEKPVFNLPVLTKEEHSDTAPCFLLDIFVNNIKQYLSSEDIKTIALSCKENRKNTRFDITHLTIPVADITQENLTDAHLIFKKVKSLKIKGKNIESQHIKLLAQAFPQITSLDLTGTGVTAQEVITLAQPGLFPDLKKLRLRATKRIEYSLDAAMSALAQAPFAKQLELLDLYNTNITSVGVAALAGANSFPALRVLNLGSNLGIQNKGLFALANSPLAEKLEELNLACTGITDTAELPQTAAFKSLKVLDVSYNKLYDTGINVLINTFDTELDELVLAGTKITVTGITSLIQSPALNALRILDLNSNDIGDVEINALVNAPFMDSLEALYLRNNKVTVAGIIALAQVACEKLKILDLSLNSKVNDDALQALSQAPFAQQLEHLDVSNTNVGAYITAAGVAHLAKPNTFISLRFLDLSGHEEIGDEGLKTLIKAPFMQTLEKLYLCKLGITSSGAALLASKNILPKLKVLAIDSNPSIQDRGLQALANADWAENIEALDVAHTEITTAGIQALSSSNRFIALKKLDLSCNQRIDDKGIAVLLKAQFASQLEQLSLDNANMTNEGLALLIQTNALPKIKILYIESSSSRKELTDTALLHDLIAASYTKQFEKIKLPPIRMTEENKKLLEIVRGMANIEYRELRLMPPNLCQMLGIPQETAWL